MSKQTNPTMIGAFVLGALVLVAAGVALFGGAQFFSERELYVAYFAEDTKGLRVGSNVLTNGVRIGQVSEIALLVDIASYETITRVTLEILPENFIQVQDGEVIGKGMEVNLTHQQLITDAGLRANLDVESFVTGQLLVELALRPDTTATLRGEDPPYPEIPTVPSNIQALLDEVQKWISEARENIDVAEWSRRMDSILSGIDELSNSEDLRQSLAGIRAIMDSDETRGLAGSVASALEDVRRAAVDASELFSTLDTDLGTLVDDVQPVITQLNATLREAEQALAAARGQLRGDSEQVMQLQATMHEIERATRAMREFFDYLERNPESLLKGRKE
jgi:paraquat-inducible protein B